MRRVRSSLPREAGALRPLRVAACQMGPAAPSLDANAQRILRLLDEAAGLGVRLAVLPELALTPYFPLREPRAGEKDRLFCTPADPAVAAVRAASRRLGISVVLPCAERDGEHRYNAAFVVDADGQLAGVYRKMHLPVPVRFGPGAGAVFEILWFDNGDLGFPTFRLAWGCLGVQICYDRHFFEGFRSLALGGAEVIALGSSSPTYGEAAAWRSETWDLLCRVRARENALFLIAAARAGREEDVRWVGRSCVIGPDGSVLARALTDGDEVVFAEIDLASLRKMRQTLTYLAARRAGTYGDLVSAPDRSCAEKSSMTPIRGLGADAVE